MIQALPTVLPVTAFGILASVIAGTALAVEWKRYDVKSTGNVRVHHKVMRTCNTEMFFFICH